MINKLLTIAFFSLSFASPMLAQMPAPEMAEQMRSDGKIYVVVLIIGIIFAGIVGYLIHLDRKLRKLENKKS